MDQGNGELSRGPLRDSVYLSVRRDIMEGVLRPGCALSEIGIARAHRTSRSPVRDAFGRLEQEGFVLRKPSGRVIVAPLDTRELQNLYEVRASVEGLAARLATPNLTGFALDDLARQLERMQAFSQAGDLPASLEAGGRFHDIISRNCANPPLIEIIEAIRGRIKRYQRIIADARQKNLRVREHRMILTALNKRDAAGAEAAMRDHILRSASAIMDEYGGDRGGAGARDA